MTEQIDTFLAITGSNDANIAENFLEMSGGDLESAISLFFEHGPSIGSATNNNTRDETPDIAQDSDSDAALAERLQNEAYSQQNQQSDLRAPDEAVHERLVGDDEPVHFFSGSYGGVGGAYSALLNNRRRDLAQEIYGSGTAGVFNQRDDQDYTMADSDEEEERLYEVGSDGEPVEKAETAEERLARLFRPPFDIMEKLDLNSAKAKARAETKWLLVNIQDNGNFQCHALNRDFWSNLSVKEIVREYFVLLQYNKDSRNGQDYEQFYHFEEYPHIAILDPITGERFKMWSKVPDVSEWLEEITEFLDQFSLDKGTINPIVEHKKKIDPTTLTEEEQLEYAINQSLGNKDENDTHDVKILKPAENKAEEPKELTEDDIVKSIEPLSTPEPTEGEITRVQIRTGDGKRVVRKFSIDDKVLAIYQFVKSNFEQLQNDKVFFTLTSQRDNLFPKINDSIGEAGLKNASILLEIQDEGK